MPRSKNTPSETETPAYPLVINFGDDASRWIETLAAAVLAGAREIEVQFLGGCVCPPHEIIALRNALLGIPSSIRLVTTALASLPPLTCAAWLVGDERRIARDAVVWMPDLPEDMLRNGLRKDHAPLLEGAKRQSVGSGNDLDMDEDDSDPDDPEDAGDRRSRQKNTQGRLRCERDIRSLADVVNEWFPSWEFKGSFLTFDDLVVWDVVKPEWGFGGRGSKHRGLATRENSPQEARLNAGAALETNASPAQSTVDSQAKASADQAGGAPVHEHAESSSNASAPETAAKPSDL